MTRPSDGEVLGYFTLSPTTVRLDDVLAGLLGDPPPYRQIPGFFLGQLGVASAVQDQGVGRALVVRAYDTAPTLARGAGACSSSSMRERTGSSSGIADSGFIG